MKRVEIGTAIKTICFDSILNHQRSIKKMVFCFVTTFFLIGMITPIGECYSDTISDLSFSHDGKKVVFDRCADEGCQIQVYDLETGELAAYQSPKNERWTMGKYSYDGKRIVLSVIPIIDGHLDLSEMQIAVMDVDGKNYKKVTTGTGAKLYPVFSHSGKKVLYARAAYIRKKGKTPAAQYDAWEVDLDTGVQTQLTYFKYFYMSYLAYYPDDKRFIYYGELPESFPGIDLPKNSPRKTQEIIRQEQMKRNLRISGVLAMKIGETLPTSPYNFDKGFYAKRPLLSEDGSVLIIEKGGSAGKFYLYSEDGNHRLVHHAGSIESAALSQEGALLGICRDDSFLAMRVSDDAYYRGIFLRRFKDWDNKVHKMPYLRLLPEKPLKLLNR